MEKYLIVNADDYGHTHGVSEGIRIAHLQGIVTSTTAMMNYLPSLETLKTAQNTCPDLGLGVHLVLTSGKPLLPVQQVPSLVMPNGSFPGYDAFITRLENINPDEALLEWRAQVELFVAATGHTPDHLDSHHHSSYFTPALFERMLSLAQEYQCPIRNPFGAPPISFGNYLPEGSAEKYGDVISNLLTRFHPRTPQVFMVDFYDEGVTLETLKQIAVRIDADSQHDSFELMVHPAVVDEDLRQTSSYNDMRSQELAILQNEEIKTLLNELDIRLIRFFDLPQ